MRFVRRLAFFAAISLATRWLGLVVDVLDVDEAAHIVGSWQWLAGRLLYVDFVDNKPPLLYVYYALAQALGHSLVSVRLFTSLVTVPLTAFGVSAFFDHDRRGLVGALVFLVYSASFVAHDMVSVHAELPMLLPATWALVLVRDEASAGGPWRVAAAAALLGVATLVKPQAALWLLALVAASAGPAWRSGRRHVVGLVILLGAGFTMPLAATWQYFASLGAAGALVRWTLAANVTYVANPMLWGEALERSAGSLAPFLVVTAPLWWAALRGQSENRDDHRRRVALVALAATTPAGLLGFRFFPHYFVQFYVPLALASAPTIATWLDAPRRQSARAFITWTAVLAVLATIVNAVLYLGPRRVYRETDPVYRAVAARLAADPCAKGATLFVWGWAPIFYYYSGMPPATRFSVLATSGLTSYVAGNLASAREEVDTRDHVDPAQWDLLMADLERNRATFVLDTAPAGLYRWNHHPVARYPRLRDYLAANFDVVATVERVSIYRRRDCAGRTP